MTIILFILKIIGILLLSLLGIVILLLALLLFVPVHYRIKGEIEEAVLMQGKLHWLLHIVTLSAVYEKENFSYELRICGIRVMPRKKKKSALEDTDFDEPEALQEPETQEMQKTSKGSETQEALKTDAGETQTADNTARQREDLPDKKISVLQKLRDLFHKVKQTVLNIVHTFKSLPERMTEIKNILGNEENKKVVSFVFAEIKYLLHHMRLRKIKTELQFSLGDPAATGQILGLLCVIPWLYQYEVNIYPDFEAEQFYVKGSYFMKGHIRLIHVLVSLLRLWKKREFRRFIRRLKKAER